MEDYARSQASKHSQTYYCTERHSTIKYISSNKRENDYWQVNESKGSVEQKADGKEI